MCGRECVVVNVDKEILVWDERKRWIKNNKNQMPFSSIPCQR